MQRATKQQSIVFFGNERLATGVTTTAPTLQALVQAGYRVAAVVSHYERSQSRNARDLEIAAVAEQHGIPVLLPDKPADIIDQLRGFDAVAGVLVAYGKIIPQSIIDLFPRGIINIHPSLLPLHRGPTPVESVILEGARETGVSIMALASAMDAGPLYDQTTVALQGNETKQALAGRLLEHGSKLLLESLPGILDGSLPSQPQDDARATYDQLIRKEDGLLDLTKPAVQLEREVRAYAVWPKSRTVLGGKEVVVTAVHVAHSPSEVQINTGPKSISSTIWLDNQTNPKQFGFYTSHGILVVDQVKPAGKPDMSAEAFIAGYRQLLNI